MADAEPDPSQPAVPIQRLTSAQRSALLTYARAGSIAAAAEALGLSVQTVKNNLVDAYRVLGVRSGPQAIYLVMGGDDVAARLPAAVESAAPYLTPVTRLPVLADGQLTIDDLRVWARAGDAEAAGSMKATLVECVDWLAYHVRPRGWRVHRSPEPS